MIRQSIKNIFYIVLIFAGISFTWQIRGCLSERSPGTTGTVFITDTLEYEIPDYVDRPSLLFKLGHVHSEPRTTRPIRYQPWMDSVYAAYAVVMCNSNLDVKGKRDQVTHEQTFGDVSPNYELYGTPTGFKIIRNRFSNPISWSGFWLYNELSIVPNITNSFGAEVGFQFWRIKLDAYGEYRQMKQDGQTISDNVIGIKTGLRIF